MLLNSTFGASLNALELHPKSHESKKAKSCASQSSLLIWTECGTLLRLFSLLNLLLNSSDPI